MPWREGRSSSKNGEPQKSDYGEWEEKGSLGREGKGREVKEGRKGGREREGRIDLGAGHEERSAAWGGGLSLIGDARALGGRDTSTRGLKVI